MGAREYAPRAARWLQQDTIDVAGGHPNLYLYCLNNPVNLADPTGTAPEWLHGLLDVGGCVPGVGELADLTNAVLYLTEGDLRNAGISAASVIPGVGDTAKGARWAARAAKVARASSYRARLLKYSKQMGIIESAEEVAQCEAHHMIPVAVARRHSQLLQRLGIDMNDPRYGAWWEKGEHRRKSHEYAKRLQERLQEVLDAGREPTREEVWQWLEELARDYNLHWRRPH